jgi:PAS domain S-box-containing protein
VAHDIFEKCTTLESNLLTALADGEDSVKGFLHLDRERAESELSYNEDGEIQQHAKILMEPDYRLIHSLIVSQQNFVVSDPSLPDNPIVYASEGFCRLSGYRRDEIMGRNCRFLQGPGTDQGAVDIIRKGVSEGRDISVCLLNYKADGTPFWNQFFVGALRDVNDHIVNYVGVQCEVNTIPVTEMKDRVKRLPVPDGL